MDLREVPDQPFQRHPWEVARWRFFFRVMQEGGALDHPGRVLDVGAGDAFFAKSLIDAAPVELGVTCWDSAYDETNREILPADAAGRLGFCAAQPEERFDLILLLDILEHVDDDVEFLSTIVRRNARPGGVVLISVPARMALFSRHDRYLRHFRRYAPRDLSAVIERAGLEELRRGGLFHSLTPIRYAQKLKEAIAGRLLDNGDDPAAQERYKGLGDWRGGPRLTSLLTGVLEVDNWISLRLSRAGVGLPGLSWWALCTTRAS